MPRALCFSPAVLILLAALCGHAAGGPIPKTVTWRNHFGEGFSLERPVSIVEMPGRDSVFAVTQQSGAVMLVRRTGNAWVKTVFDTVSVGGVNSGTAGEDGGLLGFAFHPYFQLNRKYYLYYVASYSVRANPGRIRFEERRADSTLLRRDAAVAPRLILSLDKPYIYHNGGTLRFGADGALYTAIGDGGGSGDPENRAQTKNVLWGKFLRLNVDGEDAYPNDSTRNYGIPNGNPFADSAGYLPEIWALGVRSPWKWDWNPFTGAIWLGDIGQSRYEEITRVPKGANLGWRVREGSFCYPSGTTCATDGLTPPVFTFPSRTFGQSVTGGTFFVGDTTSAYHGVYLYGDFNRNKLYALRPDAAGTGWSDTATLGTLMNLVSLEKDRRGNILAVSMASADAIAANTGAVYILESPDMRPDPGPVTIAQPRRTPLPISRIRAAPGNYDIRTLDGRRLQGAPSGVFWIREKKGAQTHHLTIDVR